MPIRPSNLAQPDAAAVPESVLVALILSVAVYGLVVGVAAVRALRQRGRDIDGLSPPASVSVVVPDESETGDRLREPTGERVGQTPEVEIVTATAESIPSAVEEETGDVILIPGAEPPEGRDWIHAMSAHCTPESPVAAGPTIVEHNDHFLPRLEALQHIGYTALFTGLTSGPPPQAPAFLNLAVRPQASDRDRLSDWARPSRVAAETNESARFVDDPRAALPCPPAGSFDVYFSRFVELVKNGFQSLAASGKLVGLALLATHAVLLASCVVAVAHPAWRQPTLLALLGKMGADGFLLAPAAHHYNERGLLRSFVPSELLLVAVVPFAGLFAVPGLRGLFDESGRSP